MVNYWECELELPGVFRLHLAEVGENACHGDVVADSRWLRAVTPPFNPFADRRTCSEFRSFDRLLEHLAQQQACASHERTLLRGRIEMLINAPPCVSCIGVLRQFQLLYPNVVLQVSGGQHLFVDVQPISSPSIFSNTAWAVAVLTGIDDASQFRRSSFHCGAIL